MPRLAVKNISLTFPLYARTGRVQTSDRPEDRIARSEDGIIRGVYALRNISLELRSGDRLAIIGRNGSGKTTLLRLMAGILTPDQGSIEVEGRSTSIVNINLGLQPEATGHRNITLRGLAAGRTRQEIEEKRGEIADFSELRDFLDMPLLTYSSGMKMRLSFAIATAFQPEILLLDEWIGAGDARFRQKATDRMKKFVSQAGILVLASHSRQLLRANCNKAIWLEGGRMKDVGDIKPILRRYRETTLDKKIHTPEKTLKES